MFENVRFSGILFFLIYFQKQLQLNNSEFNIAIRMMNCLNKAIRKAREEYCFHIRFQGHPWQYNFLVNLLFV